MTEREGPMTELQFDELLGTWLADGAHATPDRIAENAMLEIATVPQERNWLAAMQSSFASAPVAWAAAILALAVGIGLLVGTRLVGNPNPSPTPDPNALVLQSYEDAGYELEIPASWSEVDSGYADAQDVVWSRRHAHDQLWDVDLRGRRSDHLCAASPRLQHLHDNRTRVLGPGRSE